MSLGGCRNPVEEPSGQVCPGDGAVGVAGEEAALACQASVGDDVVVSASRQQAEPGRREVRRQFCLGCRPDLRLDPALDRDDVGEYICNGNCPAGREYLYEGEYSWSTEAMASICDVSLVDSVWMVAYGGTSWVELPNGAYEYLGSNFSTGHYLICPN
jgi:hypothetical protein